MRFYRTAKDAEAVTEWRTDLTLLDLIMRRLALKIAPLVRDQLLTQLARYLAEQNLEPAQLMNRVESIIDKKFEMKQAMTPQMFSPNYVLSGTASGEYMTVSNALARDFLHPEFAEFCRIYGMPMQMHRKLWEWAFVYEHLKRADVLRPGMRGIGFGVGTEKLASLFASRGVSVTATDAVEDVLGWGGVASHSSSADQLFYPDLISREMFDANVSFEPCDMNAIPDHLVNYDFCWSSCSMEHLGSLQHGLDFVINSVEKTLRIGGIGCHTTEFNLSSNDETVEREELVLYRKKDLERLCETLEARGHQVNPLRIEPGDLPPDYLVDVPPYGNLPHLKLSTYGHVATSAGIVVRRGR